MLDQHQKYAQLPKGSSDRAFGFVFSAVFFIVACYPVTAGGAIRVWSLIVAGVFLLLALLAPCVLGPINRLWMKFGDLLHRIVGPIALAIVFFAAVLPTGLLIRMFGKDPLRLRREAGAESYWIRRAPAGPDAESLNNQF